jgi:multiple sugar transport system permease protein
LKKRKTVEYGKYGLLFLIPFFLVFLVFQFYPLMYTIFESFEYTFKNGRNMKTTRGLGSYTNYVFGKAGGNEIWKGIYVTVIMWVMNFIPQVLLALLLAAWFSDVNLKIKGAGAYKVIMYMPNIITAATIAVLFYNLFNTTGAMTKIFEAMGIAKGSIIDKGWSSLFIIAFIQFWMWYGNTMIVLCAGILGINPSLYEAAMVDGATGKQQFFRITLPLLKPILQFTLVTSAIGGLQMFDIPSLFNNGGPITHLLGERADSTTTVTMLIKNYVNNGPTQNMGRAAAYSVVLFVITLCISLVFYKLTSEKKPKDGR